MSRFVHILDDDYGYCTNSGRWLIFELYGCPRSCPYKGMMGSTDCKYEGCGYYEERKLTPYARAKFQKLFGGNNETFEN
jgi:hypothetical protein